MRNYTLKLSRRADGRFQKKIDGKLYYFGDRNTTEDEAQKLLLRFLSSRSQPVREPDPGITVIEAANAYAFACENRVADGLILSTTFDDYREAIQRFIDTVGKSATVTGLTPDDFARFRAKSEKRYNAWAFDREIQSVRTMFNWCYESRLIDRLPMYGKQFVKSTKAKKREERAIKGYRGFSRASIDKLLTVNDDMKAFILLALNSGMYSIDIANLKFGDIQNVNGIWCVKSYREKTKALRMFPLWQEIVDLIRPGIKRKSDRLIFTTVFGTVLNNRVGWDVIAKRFQRLKRRLQIKDGSGFGGLKHTHIQAISDHPDKIAAAVVRGHVIDGILDHYDLPTVERLKSVTDLAYDRLIKKSN